MECETVRDWLSAYRDDELDYRRSRLVKEHLTTCSDCSNQLLQETRVDSILSERPVPSAPNSLRDNVMSSVRNQTRDQRFYRFVRGAGLAATFFIGLLLGTYMAIDMDRMQRSLVSTPNSAPPVQTTVNSIETEPPTGDLATLSLQLESASATSDNF